MPDPATPFPNSHPLLPQGIAAALGGTVPRGFAVSKPVRMPTLMLVEDSRFACEVMRLYARALGLRLRRAADLETAQAHLRLYKPDIVLIDLGLPDGRGEGLIAELTDANPRPPLIIATSGQGELRDDALAAGADIFIEKPMPDLATFRALLVDHFPSPLPLLLLPQRPQVPQPDRIALKDDLDMAAKTMADMADEGGDTRYAAARTRYVAGLLDGVAGSMGDTALQAAARQQLRDGGARMPASAQDAAHGALADQQDQGFRHLRDLVNERLRTVLTEPEV